MCSCKMCKLGNGYENIDSSIFFNVGREITRGHDLTLVKEQRRLDVRKYSFSQKTIHVYMYGINDLLIVCVLAVSVCSRTE